MPLEPEQVLRYVQEHGPCVPNDIRRGLQAQDNFVVGAILSELTGAGKLAFTHLSFGTSKFYYDPSRPELLESLAQYLNEKDRHAFNLLKEHGTLKASDLTPILRLSLRNIADFSRPLLVRGDDGAQTQFWHYYLVPAQEAFERIKARYYVEPPKEAAKANSQTSASIPPKTSTPILRPAAAGKEPRKRASKIETPAQTTLEGLGEGFGAQLAAHFTSTNVSVVKVLERGKSEISCLVRVPSAVGNMTLFCRAKHKKSCSEGDIAAALLAAQASKLPLLYVTTGAVSRKAQALAAQHGATVVQPWA